MTDTDTDAVAAQIAAAWAGIASDTDALDSALDLRELSWRGLRCTATGSGN